LEETALSIWFRESGAAFFTSLTLHSLAMAFVVGINFAIALRLLGVTPRFAIAPLARFYKLHWYGVIIIFISGVALLLAYPAKALTNPVFYIKFAALSSGLFLAYWLQKNLITQQRRSESENVIKLIAGLSVFLWVTTITAGRFLAYTNSVLLASRFF